MAVERRRVQGKGVGIKDLDDFRRDLSKLKREGGFDGTRLLKAANRKVAEHVRVNAIKRAAGVGPQQLKAANTLRAGARLDRAELVLGNAKIPWAEGAEFGAGITIRANVGGPNGPNRGLGWLQFRKGDGSHLSWKEPGFGQTGYFLFPTMRAESEAIKTMYVQELDDICKIAFPNGRL